VQYLTAVVIIVILIEGISFLLIKTLRKKFQWLITPEDEEPVLDKDGLKKFLAHGYDSELGWIRKPSTWHPEKGRFGDTAYHIDSLGSRCNPGHENLPRRIVCYGDSFSFCRQVNDNETWPWYLSGLSNTGVLNFAVGNYGLDQALLRMDREIKKYPSPITIMGVVPSTIVRILCVWKHYNEFGNVFGFKPRFDIIDGKLTLVKNIIDSEDKFYGYNRYLDKIRANDYFYRTKFRKEMIRFPYFMSILKQPARNIPIIASLLMNNKDYPMAKIMDINKALRYHLFKNKYALELFYGLIDEYIKLAEKNNSTPVFLFMPQKDDVALVREGKYYYGELISRLRSRLLTIDMTDYLVKADDLGYLYSDDSVYGGHFSRDGNKFVAEKIYAELRKAGLL
jgi:hypothetical protein